MVALTIKCALAAAALLPTIDAFVPAVDRITTAGFNRPSSSVSTSVPKWITTTVGHHRSKKVGGSELASNREIGYDKESGQLQTDGAECIPDDEYCIMDDATGKLIRLTLAEKERIFLDALQSYYINGRQLLPDDQFDLLKEDLSWNGSLLVQMNRNEAKYMAAMESYLKGEPIMKNDEFDALKSTLKEEKSPFAVSTEPKCYIDTGICTVTLQEDKFRTNLLYLPAGVVISLLWLGLGFELVSPFVKVNPVIIILLGQYLIFKFAKQITDDYVFIGNKIVYGPCPSCEAENRIYFGDILGVEGFGDIASTKCKNCKVKFDVQKDSMRASTLPPKSK